MKRSSSLGIAATLLCIASSALAETDRVAYPSDYKTQHVSYATVDKSDPKRGHSVRVIYANREALEAVRAGAPLPSGTVLTMEVYKTKLDAQQAPVMDANGRFIKDALSGIFVMEKRIGWGTDYPPDLRNGEWDYARFLPSGTRHEKTDMTPCLECHKALAPQDFVFTMPQLKGEKP
jgi:hypothetical protein